MKLPSVTLSAVLCHQSSITLKYTFNLTHTAGCMRMREIRGKERLINDGADVPHMHESVGEMKRIHPDS